MDLGNQDMKKNSCLKYNKNILNKDYEEIFENELKSIDNSSKLFLFKALKSKNKSEFYLKYPDFEIRRLICKFRLSDHSLAIETGRKAFLSDFDNTSNTNLIEIILNPTNIKQVKSLGSFIKQSLELRTGGT
jgi:hypothetical protein